MSCTPPAKVCVPSRFLKPTCWFRIPLEICSTPQLDAGSRGLLRREVPGGTGILPVPVKLEYETGQAQTPVPPGSLGGGWQAGCDGRLASYPRADARGNEAQDRGDD